MNSIATCQLIDLVRLPTDTCHIVTANNRLAVFVKQQLIQVQGRQITSLPLIRPYARYVDHLAHSMQFLQQLESLWLSEFTQGWLWQQSIKTDPEAQGLMNVNQLASTANQAYKQISEWAIEVKPHEHNQEYERFLVWREQYLQLRDHLGAWDAQQVMQATLQAIAEGVLPVPQTLVLYGFYSLNPQQWRLLHAYQARGTHILQLELTKPKAIQPTLYHAPNASTEIQAAIEWAKQTLASSPEQRIAIVDPELQNRAPLVRRLLQRHLSNQRTLWHVAVGRPLSQWPLVSSVLSWLSLLDGLRHASVATHDLGEALLNTQFGLSDSEQQGFFQLDVNLRQQQLSQISSAIAFQRLAEVAPTFTQHWQSFLQQHQSEVLYCSEWVSHIKTLLQELGFPGPKRINSVNYQVCRAFAQALNQFALLDEAVGQVGFDKCVSLLKQLLTQTLFQPMRHKNTRIDIIGLYETQGGQWDAVWVLGLHSETLPAPAKPNPFIPMVCQRALNMTHATAESELELAQQIFDSVLRASTNLILSWPLSDGTSELSPSAFLQPYMSQAQALELTPEPVRDLGLEQVEDSLGLPKQGYIPGGYSLIDQYLSNPLWCYASARLGLQALKPYPVFALDTRKRGIFYHVSMQRIWSVIRSRECLEQLSVTDLAAIVDEQLALAAQQSMHDVPSKALVIMEVNRLRSLVFTLLETEKQRSDFKVLAHEHAVEFKSNGLILSLNIDRIDEQADGSLALIDYKSGSTPSKSSLVTNWVQTAQLLPSQLPLYAQFMQQRQPVTAVLFCKLTREDKLFLGVTQDTLTMPGLIEQLNPSTWSTVLNGWHQQIAKITYAIAEGQADNITSDPNSLKFCDIKPFLRYALSQQDSGDE